MHLLRLKRSQLNETRRLCIYSFAYITIINVIIITVTPNVVQKSQNNCFVVILLYILINVWCI